MAGLEVRIVDRDGGSATPYGALLVGTTKPEVLLAGGLNLMFAPSPSRALIGAVACAAGEIGVVIVEVELL